MAIVRKHAPEGPARADLPAPDHERQLEALGDKLAKAGLETSGGR